MYCNVLKFTYIFIKHDRGAANMSMLGNEVRTLWQKGNAAEGEQCPETVWSWGLGEYLKDCRKWYLRRAVVAWSSYFCI